MKRTAIACLVLTALSGCVSSEGGRSQGEGMNVPPAPGAMSYSTRPSIPGAMGPWGAPVPVHGPYAASPPSGAEAAKSMLAQSVPLDLMQRVGYNTAPGAGGGIFPAGGPMPPPGGMMPPGGGPPVLGAGGNCGPGTVAAVGALPGPYTSQFSVSRTSVRFSSERELYGMKVAWYTAGPDGRKVFGTPSLEIPGRYNFAQAAIYRLKLTDIPGYPSQELYPTLEVVPGNSKTATFLAHSSVPVTFTREDLRTVIEEGNYLVKVIYLPDPQFQDVAISGTGELISTQLEPGVDPIAEACKRGNILLVVRLGNIDLEAKHSPPLDAPPGAAPARPAQPPLQMPPAGPLGSIPASTMPLTSVGSPGSGFPLPGVPMGGAGGPLPPGYSGAPTPGPASPMIFPSRMMVGPGGPALLPPYTPPGTGGTSPNLGIPPATTPTLPSAPVPSAATSPANLPRLPETLPTPAEMAGQGNR